MGLQHLHTDTLHTDSDPLQLAFVSTIHALHVFHNIKVELNQTNVTGPTVRSLKINKCVQQFCTQILILSVLN